MSEIVENEKNSENESGVSEKQLEANRQNAQKGGVKTSAGKERVKFNAVKHGILVKCLTEEEGQQVLTLQERLFNEYQPQTAMEEILVERIAVLYVRLQRAIKSESEYMMKLFNPTITKKVGGYDFNDELIYGTYEIVKQGYIPKLNVSDIELFEKTFFRYEISLERSFFRTLHELQRMQAYRAGEKIPAPVVVDIDVSSTE